MKIVKQTLVAAALLASSFSSFADGWLRTNGDGLEWGDYAPAALEAYNIEFSKGQQGIGGISQYGTVYQVSGYQLCPGVFLFQSVIDGKRHDLIFDNEELAKKFKTTMTNHAMGSNIYVNPGKKVAAVGYKTVDKAGKNTIRLLYLPYDDHTAENYACKESHIPKFKEGMWLSGAKYSPSPF